MTFTVTPAAGAKLRASVLSALMAERTPMLARKAADQTVVTMSSTVLINDTDLLMALSANTTYEVRLRMNVRAATAADIKVALTFPAGATFNVHSITVDTPTNAIANLISTSAIASGATVNTGTAGVGTSRGYWLDGLLIVAGTAGTLQTQWAQVVSDASNVTVMAGSYLRLTQTE